MSIVTSTKQSTELINQISKASTHQAEFIIAVNNGVEHISSVIQNNSSTAEQSAASSEELSGQLQILKSLVSEFTVKQDGINKKNKKET